MNVRKGDIVLIDEDFPYNGSIMAKKRPFVVVSNDIGNEHSTICLVCPLTTKKKVIKQPTQVLIDYNSSVLLTEQIFTIKQANVKKIIGHLNEKDSINASIALMIALGILQ